MAVASTVRLWAPAVGASNARLGLKCVGNSAIKQPPIGSEIALHTYFCGRAYFVLLAMDVGFL